MTELSQMEEISVEGGATGFHSSGFLGCRKGTAVPRRVGLGIVML